MAPTATCDISVCWPGPCNWLQIKEEYLQDYFTSEQTNHARLLVKTSSQGYSSNLRWSGQWISASTLCLFHTACYKTKTMLDILFRSTSFRFILCNWKLQRRGGYVGNYNFQHFLHSFVQCCVQSPRLVVESRTNESHTKGILLLQIAI